MHHSYWNWISSVQTDNRRRHLKVSRLCMSDPKLLPCQDTLLPGSSAYFKILSSLNPENYVKSTLS